MAEATAGRVSIALADGVADVRFTRADRLNALDMAQFKAVAGAIATLTAMPGLRCVVLSGEGRAFCAGSTWRCWQAPRGWTWRRAPTGWRTCSSRRRGAGGRCRCR